MAKPLTDDFHPVVLFENSDDDGDLFDLNDLKRWAEGQSVQAVVEKVVDKELDSFDSFMRSIGNESLARPERAILKTYLGWRLGLGPESTKNAR